jgi:hypothetical protein
MKERPIIFNSDEVRGIIDGRKTMMRRVIKPQPFEIPYRDCYGNEESACFWRYGEEREDWPTPKDCPFGQPGDRLWVKETHIAYEQYHVQYFADSLDHSRDKEYGVTWASPVRMPRWASRITLEIINVHVERLQDISEEEVRAEGFDASWLIWHEGDDAHNTRREEIYSRFGVEAGNTRTASECDEFAYLWDKLYAKRGYGWDANPWVWCVSFKVINKIEFKQVGG